MTAIVEDLRRRESQSSYQQMVRVNENESSLSSFLINTRTQENDSCEITVKLYPKNEPLQGQEVCIVACGCDCMRCNLAAV